MAAASSACLHRRCRWCPLSLRPGRQGVLCFSSAFGCSSNVLSFSSSYLLKNRQKRRNKTIQNVSTVAEPSVQEIKECRCSRSSPVSDTGPKHSYCSSTCQQKYQTKIQPQPRRPGRWCSALWLQAASPTATGSAHQRSEPGASAPSASCPTLQSPPRRHGLRRRGRRRRCPQGNPFPSLGNPARNQKVSQEHEKMHEGISRGEKNKGDDSDDDEKKRRHNKHHNRSYDDE